MEVSPVSWSLEGGDSSNQIRSIKNKENTKVPLKIRKTNDKNYVMK